MLINIRENADKKVWITADPHLGHDPKWPVPIWKKRGFNSAKACEDGIIESYNAVVRSNDILIVIGDFCLNTTMDKFNEQLSRIQCQNIYYLLGNHNNPQEKSVYRKIVGYEMVDGIQVVKYPVKYRNMLFLPHYVEAILNGQYVVMCHYPMFVFNEMKHGAWHLCGHSHCSFANSNMSGNYGKILDVGWDEHCGPWSLTEIADVMKNKPIPQVDHHQ